jgi:phospholipid/cholesterol/gamma-HCH transport system permease protein
MLTAPLATLGNRIAAEIEGFGRFTLFVGSAFGWFFRGVRSWSRPSLLMPLFFQIGSKSIGVVMIVGTFIGMVLAIEAYNQFASIGQEARLGGIIGMSVVKQIGPVLAAVMIAGRVGGSVSAELGTMRVTEQIDALRVMGADPIAYLVVPRVLTCVIMLPLLTVFSDLMGVMGGWYICVRGYGVNAADYWDFSARFVTNYDILSGLTKTVFFGLAIGLISCYKGFNCDSGAAGVGRAATQAFVTSFIVIIVMNFFLAKFLRDFYILVFGHPSVGAFSG